ncbi:transglutaminase N-terminal domain-containing protein [Candidatus Poriferisodalis sp.]|uniref:transglutaminase N-terminal domain-containing protein n=1 Tax=Candidatus Poriferisodalis sp. TaxID=3101277 RepID=UPI003B58DA24
MRLDIAYRLHFQYAEPVTESQNEIRVRPRHDLRQQLLSYRLTTTPATRVLATRDYFGTTVDHLGVRAPHEELLVVAEASVETTAIEATPEPVSCERLGDQRSSTNMWSTWRLRNTCSGEISSTRWPRGPSARLPMTCVSRCSGSFRRCPPC